MEPSTRPNETRSELSSRILGVLLVLLGANLVGLFFLYKLLPQPEVAVVPKWEYRCQSVPDLAFESGMNELGAGGWELVVARRANGADDEMSYEMIFKRPVAKK